MTNPNHTDTSRSDDLVASLRALSAWLIANDLDMKLPDEVGDPDDAADRIEALVAEVKGLRDVIDVIWVEASTMKNASKLIGPYPTQPEKNRIWARSVCHIGKRLMEIIQPIRAKLGEKQ